MKTINSLKILTSLCSLLLLADSSTAQSISDRFTLTGYVEIATQRNFSSIGNHHSSPLGDSPSWNLNLPKFSLWGEFDCGKGWSLGTQIEFVNNGAVAMQGAGNSANRPMDWLQELTLSEIWVQKSFSDAANLKIGLIGTPVGRQNDMPHQFFSVIRPEDGPAFLPLNNQSPAVDFNGIYGAWEYDIMFIPGFVDYEFGNGGWRYGKTDNSYTQTIDRLYAGAFRINNKSINNLVIGLSGEVGGGTTWITDDSDATDKETDSTLIVAALDWDYCNNNLIFRGACQYGYVNNNSSSNNTFITPDLQGLSIGAEIGYDLLSLCTDKNCNDKLYLFGRYDNWQYQITDNAKSSWSNAQRFSIGINWMPMSSIIAKAEWGMDFDNDPSRMFAGASIAYQW